MDRGRTQVRVAIGEGTDSQKGAIAQLTRDSIQSSTGKHYVGGSECHGELLRSFLRNGTKTGLVAFKPVVEKLAGMESVALFVRWMEFDARAMPLGSQDAFAFFEVVEAHIG